MLRFALKLFIFLSPILLMLGLVEHRLTTVPTGYRIKRMYLERNIDKVQVLITGSSHSYEGIKSNTLGAAAFNLAYVSQDIYYDTRIVLKILPRAKSAKLVIVPISYLSLEYMLEDSPHQWRSSCYYQFWDIPHGSPGFRIADSSLIALYGVQQTRSFLVGGIPADNPDDIDESGNSGVTRSTKIKFVMDASNTLARHKSYMKPQHLTQNGQYLEELFHALKAKGISIVIITTPCFHSYFENLNPEAYARMQDEIQRLSRNYGLEYRNYLTDSRFTIEDFEDGDHLSTVGAEKFSEILRDEVVRKYVK